MTFMEGLELTFALALGTFFGIGWYLATRHANQQDKDDHPEDADVQAS